MLSKPCSTLSRAILAFLACLVLASATPAHADTDERPRIVVSGSATLRGTPDRALLTLAVESRAPKPSDAQQANAVAMDAVLEKLRGSGIPKDALRTLAYSIREDFDYDKGRRIPRGYLAENTVEVRLDDIESVGRIIDTAVEAGATSVRSVAFDLKDRSGLERRALELAVQDARGRAAAIARGAGVGLGPILLLSEQRVHGGRPPQPMRMARAVESKADTPIHAGEIEVRAEVTLTAGIAR